MTTAPGHLKVVYTIHAILAACVAVVLALTLNLWATDAPDDVVGGAMFVLLVPVGLPILCLSGAALLYSCKARHDWRLTLLTAVLIVMIVEWGFLLSYPLAPSPFVPPEERFYGGPALIAASIILESLYVGLAIFFRLRWAKRVRT